MPKCEAETKLKNRCKNKAKDGYKYCATHLKQYSVKPTISKPKPATPKPKPVTPKSKPKPATPKPKPAPIKLTTSFKKYGTTANHILIEYPSKSFKPFIISGRYIIKITLVLKGDIILSSCFYLSSGTNTGELGYKKWFPFDGICKIEKTSEVLRVDKDGSDDWYFKKLADLSVKNRIIANKTMCNFKEGATIEPLLCRIGNDCYMFVSYLLSGWDNAKSMLPSTYVKEFKHLLKLFGSLESLDIFRKEFWATINIKNSKPTNVIGVNSFVGTSISYNYFLNEYYPENHKFIDHILKNNNMFPVNVTRYMSKSSGIIPQSRSIRPRIYGLFNNFDFIDSRLNTEISGIKAYIRIKFKHVATDEEILKEIKKSNDTLSKMAKTIFRINNK